MSMAALLLAATTQLQTSLASLVASGLRPADFIDMQPEGRPPAKMGEWYIALDEGRVEAADKGFLKERFTIEVTITKRTGKYAPDRYRQVYTDNAKGLEQLERAVIVALHGNQNVRVQANTNANVGVGGVSDIFQQPIWYAGRTRTTYKGAEWAGSGKETDSFLVRVLPFAGAIRVQSFAVMA